MYHRLTDVESGTYWQAAAVCLFTPPVTNTSKFNSPFKFREETLQVAAAAGKDTTACYFYLPVLCSSPWKMPYSLSEPKYLIAQDSGSRLGPFREEGWHVHQRCHLMCSTPALIIYTLFFCHMYGCRSLFVQFLVLSFNTFTTTCRS